MVLWSLQQLGRPALQHVGSALAVGSALPGEQQHGGRGWKAIFLLSAAQASPDMAGVDADVFFRGLTLHATGAARSLEPSLHAASHHAACHVKATIAVTGNLATPLLRLFTISAFSESIICLNKLIFVLTVTGITITI